MAWQHEQRLSVQALCLGLYANVELQTTMVQCLLLSVIQLPHVHVHSAANV